MLIIFYKVHQDINYKIITPMENSDTDWKKKIVIFIGKKVSQIFIPNLWNYILKLTVFKSSKAY